MVRINYNVDISTLEPGDSVRFDKIIDQPVVDSIVEIADLAYLISYKPGTSLQSALYEKNGQLLDFPDSGWRIVDIIKGENNA